MATTFAERLRWARYLGPAAQKSRKPIGATVLARHAGCAQSLISSLERGNAKSSEHNNKFAECLGVDKNWLATGNPATAPDGFNEDQARQMRQLGGERLLSIVHAPPPQTARWAAADEAQANGISHLATPRESPSPQDAVALQKAIVNDFMTFAELAGADRSTALLGLLKHYVDSLLGKQSARQHQS